MLQYNTTVFFERLTKIKSYSKTLHNVSSATSFPAVMNSEQVRFESWFERWSIDGAWRTIIGRLFHSDGPATEKARRPSVPVQSVVVINAAEEGHLDRRGSRLQLNDSMTHCSHSSTEPDRRMPLHNQFGLSDRVEKNNILVQLRHSRMTHCNSTPSQRIWSWLIHRWISTCTRCWCWQNQSLHKQPITDGLNLSSER